MKRFYTLLKMEYTGLLPSLCVLLALMAVAEAGLFGFAFWLAGNRAPLAFLIDDSGVPFVFIASYIAFLCLIVYRYLRGYSSPKTVYALFTLPVRRGFIFGAKMAAALLAWFNMLALQMLLLLAALAVYGDTGRNAVWLIALLDSWFLRLLFPPEPFSLIYSLIGLSGFVCVAIYATPLFKARDLTGAFGSVGIIIYLVRSFPLHANHMGFNILILCFLSLSILAYIGVISFAGTKDFME